MSGRLQIFPKGALGANAYYFWGKACFLDTLKLKGLSTKTLIWKLLEWVNFSLVLAMIFYGIIAEIAPKYRRFSYATTLNYTWISARKITITEILQKKRWLNVGFQHWSSNFVTHEIFLISTLLYLVTMRFSKAIFYEIFPEIGKKSK